VIAQSPIKWRLQTYAGAALGPHVTKPAVDMFNAAAKGEMEIELFYADQLVPTGELFRAMQAGTIDAVHSDDDSMASPREISVFGGYFPFATKHILDVPVLFNQYGLAEIWREQAYQGRAASSGSRRSRTRATSTPRSRSTRWQTCRACALHLPDRRPLPGAVRRVPVSPIPYEDVQVAVQTGELDGMAWSGITEDYTVRLGRRDRPLHDQQHLRRVDRLLVRQREEAGRCRST
jgi:hypothetical protein